MNFLKSISKMAVMLLMSVLLFAGTSFGTPVNSYWDLGTVGLGTYKDDGNTITSLFDQILYLANINTIQYDSDGSTTLSVGDTYVSDGNVIATNLNPVQSNDTEGMNVAPYLNSSSVLVDTDGYEFTFVLSDLVGVVDNITANGSNDIVINRYTSGVIDLYLDNTLDSTFNGTLDLSDDSGFGLLGSTTAIHVATISNVHGIGSSTFTSGSTSGLNPSFLTGSFDIQGTFTYLLDNFWYDESGEDLNEKLVSLSWLIGTTDGNIDLVAQDFSTHGESAHTTFGKVLYTINSDSNASFELAAVPEPATMLLLGSGLLGFGIIGRKKTKISKK